MIVKELIVVSGSASVLDVSIIHQEQGCLSPQTPGLHGNICLNRLMRCQIFGVVQNLITEFIL